MPIEEAQQTPQERIYFRDADGVPTATAVFVRDSGAYAALLNLHLSINGAKAASIAPSEKVTVRLPAGEYVFGVYPTNIYGSDIQHTTDQKLDAGRTYFFRLSLEDRVGAKIQRVIKYSVE